MYNAIQIYVHQSISSLVILIPLFIILKNQQSITLKIKQSVVPNEGKNLLHKATFEVIILMGTPYECE